MTPAERVALILHDVFGYSFTEAAKIVGRTPGGDGSPDSGHALSGRTASQPLGG